MIVSDEERESGSDKVEKKSRKWRWGVVGRIAKSVSRVCEEQFGNWSQYNANSWFLRLGYS